MYLFLAVILGYKHGVDREEPPSLSHSSHSVPELLLAG